MKVELLSEYFDDSYPEFCNGCADENDRRNKVCLGMEGFLFEMSLCDSCLKRLKVRLENG